MGQRTSGAHILLVEDSWIVASQIEAVVLEAGYCVVGPTGHLAEAIEMASTERIAAALLDIELIGGEQAYPVAEALMARGIPFAFISSRLRREIDPVYRDLPSIGKPFRPATLLATLSELVGDHGINKGR
jgi:DNA-binding response OmpR family regulator